jgi:HYR domain
MNSRRSFLGRASAVAIVGSAVALALAVGSSVAASPGGARPAAKPKRPVIYRHADMRAEATSAKGAIVRYRPARVVGATSVKYSKASGAWFELGTTVVKIVATNRVGTTKSTFKVKVVDTTPPTITPLADATVAANDPTGSTYAYTATATDKVDPSVSVTCTPPSGSLFPIGTTTVTCAARDASGNGSSVTFKVIVNRPALAGVAPSGHYTGSTSQGRAVSFTVSADGFQITAVSVGIDYTCTPSASLTGAVWTVPAIAIGWDGSFSATGSGTLDPGMNNGLGGTWSATVTGAFAASGQVTGTIQAHDSLISPGAYQCDAGTVTWSASRTS